MTLNYQQDYMLIPALMEPKPVEQGHKSMTREMLWHPINHTSRNWTAAEAGYSQIEQESNGILTGCL